MSVIDDIKRDEGLKLKPYLCSAGKLTIGYGRNIEDRGVTLEEAEYLLSNDIVLVMNQLKIHLDFFNDLPKNVKDAMVNMCFNLGINRFLKFKKMLAALDAGDYERAAAEALDSRWARQVGARSVRIANQIKGE